jgi:hypothetical protein
MNSKVFCGFLSLFLFLLGRNMNSPWKVLYNGKSLPKNLNKTKLSKKGLWFRIRQILTKLDKSLKKNKKKNEKLRYSRIQTLVAVESTKKIYILCLLLLLYDFTIMIFLQLMKIMKQIGCWRKLSFNHSNPRMALTLMRKNFQKAGLSI